MSRGLGDRKWDAIPLHFAWVFLLNGIVYAGWNLYSRHFRNRMLPARDELTIANLRTELRDQFRWRSRRHNPSGSYRTLQKTSYVILIFVFVPLMTLTGIAQSPVLPPRARLLDLFGGRQTARTLHTIAPRCWCCSSRPRLEVVARDSSSRVRSMITGRFGRWRRIHEQAHLARAWLTMAYRARDLLFDGMFP